MTVTAYLVQTYANPPQVDRLVRRLRTEDPRSLVHVSHSRAGPPLLGTTTSLDRVHVSYDVGGRGRFHGVQRWLDAVEWLIAVDEPVDYVVTLTGQDYPIKPAAELHRALSASGDGLVEHFPSLQAPGWPPGEGRMRYCYRWHEVLPLSPGWTTRLHGVHAVNRLQSQLRFNVSYGALRVGVLRRQQPFEPELQLWCGSFFTNISWRAATHVLDVVQSRPDIVKWARQSLVPEEAFFPSVLVGAGRFAFDNTSGRYYDFTRSRHGSPAVLSTADVPAALASDAFFARKWGADYRTAYDVIDAALDGVRSPG